MLKNRKKHDKKCKTITDIDYHSQKDLNNNKNDDEKFQFSQFYKIRNRRTLSFYRFNRSINDFAESNKTLPYEFKSLQATKTNNTDTIENTNLQLKELRVEVFVKESEDLVKEFHHLEEDLEKDLESLRRDHHQLKEE
ncbi:17413_t:CDS:1 [Dentiscutata erythropus]|uniref:17413_t:CDS:1 n=1 Tax=Dentiscutata erythropus TaxID=1348616 RepID=A0A9N9IWH7_9GLOM|nr:17413_t:CDS:1 [Dentiscutata erythropus]